MVPALPGLHGPSDFLVGKGLAGEDEVEGGECGDEPASARDMYLLASPRVLGCVCCAGEGLVCPVWGHPRRRHNVFSEGLSSAELTNAPRLWAEGWQVEAQQVEAHNFTFKVTMLELLTVRGGTRGWLCFQPIQLFRSSRARSLLLKHGADGVVEHQVNVMRL